MKNTTEDLNNICIGQYQSYTGFVRYVVKKHEIIQQYCDQNDIYSKFTQEHNYRQSILEFQCENANFNITKSGFINWESGTFINGCFIGDFNNGVWNNGVFCFGNFEKSIWKNGIWDGHLFRKSIWKNGLWCNGDFNIEKYTEYKNLSEYSTNELFIITNIKNNLFNNDSTNVFLESIWENGIWSKGLVQNSTWLNGKWSDGIFKNSQWVNGVWNSGVFDASVWVDGQWKGGKITKKSSWLAGMFSCYDQISEPELDDDEKIQMFPPALTTINFKVRQQTNEQ